MSDLVFLDVETTGLDPNVHSVWEIAYAVDDGPILSEIVAHRLNPHEAKALEINGYHERVADRVPRSLTKWGGDIQSWDFEAALMVELQGATIAGANPSFDAAMLTTRWAKCFDSPPWSYRLLDIEAYAMGALGYDRPRGLHTICADLAGLGHEMPTPDHTAAGDVAATRAAFRTLERIYAGMRP